MSPFAHNITFSSVDLGLVMDDAKSVMETTLRNVMSLLTSSPPRIGVPPVQLYTVSDMERAFRSMQSGRNVGKIVVDMRDDALIPVVPTTRPTYYFDPDASYLIAGGLGGIGRSISRWMVNRGARHLILLSRSGAKSEEALHLVNEMSQCGVNIATPPCDISINSSVTRVFREIEHGMPPVKGCIQASMVLRDGLFENASLEDFNTAIKPKVQGTWNLHQHLPKGLDFFVLLSSMAGVAGSRAQSNYAAGNTYQNALARYRSSQGQRCISLDLGPVLSTGVVANEGLSVSLEAVGFQSIGKAELFGLLEYCCDPCNPLPHPPYKSQIITGLGGAEQMSQERLREVYWTRKPIFSILRQANRSTTAAWSSSNGNRVDYERMLKTAPSQPAATDIVLEALKSKLSKDLGISVRDIDAEKPIYSFGIDSLVSLEIRVWFMREMRAEVTIFEIMQGQSLSALAGFAANKSEYRSQSKIGASDK